MPKLASFRVKLVNFLSEKDRFSFFLRSLHFGSNRLRGKINREILHYNLEKVPQPQFGYNPLAWWKEKHTQYRYLAQLATRVFVIPASSAESERHYSAFNSRNIISTLRNNMYPETVEAISVVLEGYKNNLIATSPLNFLYFKTEIGNACF